MVCLQLSQSAFVYVNSTLVYIGFRVLSADNHTGHLYSIRKTRWSNEKKLKINQTIQNWIKETKYLRTNEN